MPEMNEKEQNCFEHFMAAYKYQWDLNLYFRQQYDEDIEYYMGHMPEGKYPLPYNMSFNKLMPRVWTILSRFMDQLYQPATHNFVSVRPRKSSDVDRSKRVEALLNFQMETMNNIDMSGGAYMFHFKWLLDTMAWGKGIAKCYWKKEERIAPRRYTIPIPVMDQNGQIVDMDVKDFLVDEPQIMYDGPYVENRPVKTFVPHPHYRNIQDMPFIFDIYRRSTEWCMQKADKGEYKNIDMLGWSQGSRMRGSGTGSTEDSGEAYAKSIGIEGALALGDFGSEYMAPEVDIMEGHGRYIFPEDESAYEVDSGYKIKGRESEAIVHIGNYKTILSLQKNTYGIRPYFALGCYQHPELFWDIGLIRLGKDIQEQFNVMANTRFTNAIMTVNQMLKVRQDADIDPAALIIKPAGIIPVEDMGDVMPLELNDATQSNIFREQEQFFEGVISDMLGLYPYNLGQTPPRQEHVGTIYSLQSMGEARTRLLMMCMDHQGFQPMLKYMMTLNTWHLPPFFETRLVDQEGDSFTPMLPGDVHWDYDFTVRYTSMEPALGKQFRIQQLLQWSQLWAQSPWLQQQQLMKATLELLDIHGPERYMKSEQQMMQEMQAQKQQAKQDQLSMMQANAMIQDELASKDDERGMMRDVAKAMLK